MLERVLIMTVAPWHRVFGILGFGVSGLGLRA